VAVNKGKTGKVFLIGAGPGDPGLITVRGKQHLEECDAVIYDNLLAPELIVAIPPETEKYYVGKKAGDHPVPQEKINELMLRLAREGKYIARLKGSDPLIFGRGGEEARFLKKHGIPFEIITGVTSGIAAPTHSGIPCTDREKASFVLFVTGHAASGKMKTSVPWEWVAEAKNGTVVIFMGVREIVNIVEKLLTNGMAPDTPAAIIERGTFPSQRTFVATLRELPDKVASESIEPPALFVLGEVCTLQPYLEWFIDRPLLGIRIMVTRPADQSQQLYSDLRKLGAEPMPFPTIATEAWHDEPGWQGLKESPDKNSWLIFTSENGVRYFFDQFVARCGDIRYLARFNIAAIGTGTSRALLAHNLEPDFIPSRATVDVLAEEIKKSIDLKDATIIRVRGNLAGDMIEKTFPETSATVVPLTVYRTFYPEWPEGLKDKLFQTPPHAILFTSASTVKGLSHNLTDDEIKKVTSAAKIFSLGPMVSQALTDNGFEITRMAEEHTLPGLLKTLLDYYHKD
jgi:uroporphyrinogen III methyltransferase/synthase